MKKLYSILLSFIVLLLFSCANEDLEPIVTFDNVGKGAYVRLISQTGGTVLDLNNIGSANFTFEVEFVDIEGGKTITNYDIYVLFDDNTSHNGNAAKSRTLFKSFTESDFTTSSGGNVGITVTYSATDVMNLLGLQASDMTADDDFEFTSEIKTKSGSVHHAGNSSAAVNGSAFAGYFDFGLACQCPLGGSQFAGSYALSYVTNNQNHDPTGSFGPIFGATPGNYTLSVRNTTTRRISFTYLPDDRKITGQRFDLRFKCNRVEFSDRDTGQFCLPGSTITLGQGDVSNFNFNDDSELTLNIVEFKKDGNCGYSPVNHTVKLTKV